MIAMAKVVMVMGMIENAVRKAGLISNWLKLKWCNLKFYPFWHHLYQNQSHGALICIASTFDDDDWEKPDWYPTGWNWNGTTWSFTLFLPLKLLYDSVDQSGDGFDGNFLDDEASDDNNGCVGLITWNDIRHCSYLKLTHHNATDLKHTTCF